MEKFFNIIILINLFYIYVCKNEKRKDYIIKFTIILLSFSLIL